MYTITLAELKLFLEGQGVTLPDFVLSALITLADGMDACLTGAAYSADVGRLIKVYAISLMGIAQVDKYVSSESAPSGASRSYRFRRDDGNRAGILAMLKLLDKSGCADALLPTSPEKIAHAGLWIARAGNCEP
jgi:hypothetical protein